MGRNTHTISAALAAVLSTDRFGSVVIRTRDLLTRLLDAARALTPLAGLRPAVCPVVGVRRGPARRADSTAMVMPSRIAAVWSYPTRRCAEPLCGSESDPS